MLMGFIKTNVHITGGAHIVATQWMQMDVVKYPLVHRGNGMWRFILMGNA